MWAYSSKKSQISLHILGQRIHKIESNKAQKLCNFKIFFPHAACYHTCFSSIFVEFSYTNLLSPTFLSHSQFLTTNNSETVLHTICIEIKKLEASIFEFTPNKVVTTAITACKR